MIPQPKTVMSHSHLQALFTAKYPDGSLLLSSDVGGAYVKDLCEKYNTKPASVIATSIAWHAGKHSK